MKMQNLDVICLANILGHDPVTCINGVPGLTLSLLNHSTDQLIEELCSTNLDVVGIEHALIAVDIATEAYDVFRNDCSRDQVDEMIRQGLLDPLDVEEADLQGALYGDVCRRFGLSGELKYYVLCTHTPDLSHVNVIVGVASAESDTDFVRGCLNSGDIEKALAFLVQSTQG